MSKRSPPEPASRPLDVSQQVQILRAYAAGRRMIEALAQLPTDPMLENARRKAEEALSLLLRAKGPPQ